MTFPRINGMRCMELGARGTPLQDELNALVLSGVKVATAGLLVDYAVEGEELETVGEEQFLIDGSLEPIARIRYTRLDVVPFCEVTWAFAQAEGEGFVDLDDWRAAHRRYWARESGVDVSDDELVVCLWFEIIAPAPAPRTAGDPDFVVAAVVIRDDAGRVLVVRKQGTSRFMLPGGKIEEDETPAQAAIRELHEEVGADLDPQWLTLLGEWTAPAANEPGLSVHGHIYEHPWVAGLRARAEIDELLWLHPDEMDARDDLAPLLVTRVLPALRKNERQPE